MNTEQITIDPIIHATGLPADVDMCGKRWLETGSPWPKCADGGDCGIGGFCEQCEICNGSSGIASASRCPECEPCSTPHLNS